MLSVKVKCQTPNTTKRIVFDKCELYCPGSGPGSGRAIDAFAQSSQKVEITNLDTLRRAICRESAVTRANSQPWRPRNMVSVSAAMPLPTPLSLSLAPCPHLTWQITSRKLYLLSFVKYVIMMALDHIHQPVLIS